jgi:TolA-binding protein
LECDAIFFKTRRELKKQRRAELKHEEECKELQRQIERMEQERIEYNEKVRQRQEERLRVAREKEEEEKKLNRKCVECNKYNIPKTLEAYRIRCGPCYTQFTKPKRLTK